MVDEYTLRHLDAWISRTVYPDEQETVREQILRLLEEDSTFADLGWPRVRVLAESR